MYESLNQHVLCRKSSQQFEYGCDTVTLRDASYLCFAIASLRSQRIT